MFPCPVCRWWAKFPKHCRALWCRVKTLDFQAHLKHFHLSSFLVAIIEILFWWVLLVILHVEFKWAAKTIISSTSEWKTLRDVWALWRKTQPEQSCWVFFHLATCNPEMKQVPTQLSLKYWNLMQVRSHGQVRPMRPKLAQVSEESCDLWAKYHCKGIWERKEKAQ